MYKIPIRKVMIMLAWALPIWSIAFAIQLPLNQYNLSYIGNTLQQRFGFILWGSLSGLYFYISTVYLMDQLQCKHKKLLTGFLISSIMMFLSTVIPYLPKVYPFWSNIHLIMALGGTAAYVVLFFAFILRFMLINIPLFQKAFSGYAMICFGCIMPIMLFASVTSLSEVIFTTFMPLFHQYLLTINKASSNDTNNPKERTE